MSQPVAIALPFALDATGAVAQNLSPDGQLSDRVTALASTLPGTRVMACGFGTDTQTLMFAPGDSMNQSVVANSLREKMATYEPGVTLVSVTQVLNAANTGISGLLCRAARQDVAGTSAVTTTLVTIGPGGTVTDYASTTAA